MGGKEHMSYRIREKDLKRYLNSGQYDWAYYEKEEECGWKPVYCFTKNPNWSARLGFKDYYIRETKPTFFKATRPCTPRFKDDREINTQTSKIRHQARHGWDRCKQEVLTSKDRRKVRDAIRNGAFDSIPQNARMFGRTPRKTGDLHDE